MKNHRPDGPRGLARDVGLQNLLANVLGTPRTLPTIGPYQLQRCVGRGGMGEVYEAVDPHGTRVALKLLATGVRGAKERFEREAEALRTIEHPAVVGYVDHGTTEAGRRWLAMEWLDGHDLAWHLAEASLSIEKVVSLATLLARGLRATHRAGVIHRDLKPSNVMLLEGTRQPKLIDFGIARGARPGSSPRITTSGIAVGSPAYMAPEQVHGQPDERTDVHGLGGLLYEALTGRPPFVAPTHGDLVLAVLSDPVPNPASFRPETPRGLDALISRMLAKDPDRRPQDMDAVLAELAMTRAVERAPFGLSHVELPPSPTPAAAPSATRVGRAREQGLLAGALADVIEQQLAGLILVHGPSGSGRTDLLEATDTRGFASVYRCTASPHDGAAAFTTMRRFLDTPESPRSASGLLDLFEERPRDPMAHADRVALAWYDDLDHATRQGPVLWLLDDGQHADLATLRLLERALELFADRPLAIVLALPTGDPPLSPAVLPDDRSTSIRLRPLPRSTLERLAQTWGRPASAVDGCGGRPGLLARRTPTSLAGLGLETRRVLRAAAIVGRTCAPAAIATVLGIDADTPSLHTALVLLGAAGLLARRGDAWHFVDEPTFLTALGASSPEDRQRGHRAVAAWLERAGAASAQIARQLEAAGDREPAARHWIEAARHELAAGFPDRARERLERADRSAAAQVDALAVRAHLDFWAGSTEAAGAAARQAMAHHPPGSPTWLELASLAITAFGQAGDNPTVAALSTEVLACPAPPADLCEPLSRALSQLSAAGVPVPDGLRQRLDVLNPDDLPARARAWWWRRDAYALTSTDMAAGFHAYTEANRAHQEAGEAREAVQLRLLLANGFTLTGEFELARTSLDQAAIYIRRLGAPYLRTWHRYTRGKLLAETTPWETAQEELLPVADSPTASPRLKWGAHIYLGRAALAAGGADEALRRGQQVLDQPVSPSLITIAHALCARARVARGDGALHGHLAAVEAALDSASPFPEFRFFLHVARIEALRHLGEARWTEAAREALAALHQQAACLRDPAWRNRLLTGPRDHRRLHALAADAAGP